MKVHFCRYLSIEGRNMRGRLNVDPPRLIWSAPKRKSECLVRVEHIQNFYLSWAKSLFSLLSSLSCASEKYLETLVSSEHTKTHSSKGILHSLALAINFATSSQLILFDDERSFTGYALLSFAQSIPMSLAGRLLSSLKSGETSCHGNDFVLMATISSSICQYRGRTEDDGEARYGDH